MTALTPVTSSNIAAIGYDPATRVMTAQFKNGGTFDYHDAFSNHPVIRHRDVNDDPPHFHRFHSFAVPAAPGFPQAWITKT